MPGQVKFTKYQNDFMAEMIENDRYKSRNDLLKDAVRLVARREAALEKLKRSLKLKKR